jgi:hypothetical protein
MECGVVARHPAGTVFLFASADPQHRRMCSSSYAQRRAARRLAHLRDECQAGKFSRRHTQRQAIFYEDG